MKTQKIDPNDLVKAAELLVRGEVVAFPTETVYGLGAFIFSEEGVQKIFKAKGRPGDNPLIAHICDLASLALIAEDIPALFYQLAERFFPGPLTIVLPKKKQVPSMVSAGLDTVAVRMPSHPVALELIKLAGAPLVAPSANLSGKPSSTRVSHVLDDFEGKIAGVVLGEASSLGIESTVVRIVSDRVEILRPGSLPQEELEEFLKQKVSLFKRKGNDDALPSPGMKYRHYAPGAKVTLAFSPEEALAGHKKMILANDSCLKGDVFPLNAASFYSYLRLADREGYQEIVIVCDPKILQNKGLMNRIEKSAGL
jgi:L-threonylcarbamoyladenylate synthase